MTATQAFQDPFIYVNDLKLSYASTTTLGVTSGRCRDSQNLVDIIVSDDVVLNSALVGEVNGLDKGTFSSASWYAVHAIGSSLNIGTPGVLLSLSATAPTLPPDYDVFRRIGWVRTAATAVFRNFFANGNGNERRIIYNLNTTDSVILSAGNATSFTAVSNMANFVPSTSRLAKFAFSFLPGAASRTAKFRPTGSSIAAADVMDVITGQVTSVVNSGEYEMETGTAQTIDYVVSNSGDALTLYAKGYTDFI